MRAGDRLEVETSWGQDGVVRRTFSVIRAERADSWERLARDLLASLTANARLWVTMENWVTAEEIMEGFRGRVYALEARDADRL
jgi:hypothetical protein